MRLENILWDRNVIFNPRGKSKKSRRYVPLTDRVKAALLARKGDRTEGWSSRRRARSRDTFPTERFPNSGGRPRDWRALPEAVDMYYARHRFGTDVMQATGNIMAAMDVMGTRDPTRHGSTFIRKFSGSGTSSIDETKLCSNLPQIVTNGRNGCWEIGS